MLVYEAKLKGTIDQYGKLDEAIRTGLFVRNACIRLWMDKGAKSRNELYKYCKTLADNPDFPWAKLLNSQARQASAERAWASISRFFENCKKNIPGKKGFPKFKKNRSNHGSVEYKQTGFKLSSERKYITFTDGFKAGSFRLWGTRDLHSYGLDKINRVRVVRRADGYYAQFLIDHNRVESREPTGKTLGLDVGLYHFYTDSNGQTVDNPRYLSKSEKAIKRLQRRVSKKSIKPKKKGDKREAPWAEASVQETSRVSERQKQPLAPWAEASVRETSRVSVSQALPLAKAQPLAAQAEVSRPGKTSQSNNYKKAQQKLALKHLKVSRQRKDFVVKTARCVVQSNDLVAYEDLKVRNMVKNHCLAKSISDASWTMFRSWVEYFGKVFGVATVAVLPHNTSQQCSNCLSIVKKSLSTRTHTCSCGTSLGRDHNAGLNILRIGLSTVGHTGINVWGEDDLCLSNGNDTQASRLNEPENSNCKV